MKRPNNLRRIAFAATVVLVLLAAAGYVWHRFAAPTRIALINFRDFQYAEFMDAKDNPFIRLDRIALEKLAVTDVGSYDAVFIFGMGLHLDDDQKSAITSGIARGTRIHVTSATSAGSDLSNLTGDDLTYVDDCLTNGGKANTRALFNYCRRVFDRKTLFSDPVADVLEIPRDVFYHIGEDTYFTTYAEYQGFYEESGQYIDDRPRVCFITSMIGPRSIDRSYADGVIELLEAKDINVYPIAGFMKRLEFLQAVEPDLVICVPHGRLAPGMTEETVVWLTEQNIPLLCPIDAAEPYDEWVSSQQGMAGGMFSQSIVMTELDGGIEPFVIGALFPDENGLMGSAGIPGRMERFVSRVEHWLSLAATPNAEKKIAIVYYKGHGRNALTASGMEVAPSLLNVLRHLRDTGYDTGTLPDSGEELAALIQTHGPVLGPYAQGAFSAFLEMGDPEMIPAATYLSWIEHQISPEAYADVVRAHGEAPGDYLTVSRNDSSFIALPRLVFGNVALVPQLLPGIGEDAEELVHGVKAAPPHPYLAEYLWIRHGFGADAVIHFGTHGSLEFTPWKQTALSSNDWPDALIGDLPHPYIYVIDNVGEALIAKRRSYAALVSHLTPPFVESDLYGGLSRLDEAVEGYETSNDAALKAAYLKTIRTMIRELDLYRDLDMTEDGAETLSGADIEELHDYLHTIGREKITSGLYTLGEPYTASDLEITARLMAIDPVTYGLAGLDAARGVLPDSLLSDPSFIDLNYRSRAYAMIDRILEGSSTRDDFIDPEDRQRLENWDVAHRTITQDELFASMLSMGAGSGDSDSRTAGTAAYSQDRLEELVVRIMADDRTQKLISDWEEGDAFEQASSLLDPESMDKAKKIAALIPAMKDMLALIEQEDVHALLAAMQDPATKETVFTLIDDPSLTDRREREAAALRASLIETAQSETYKHTLFATTDGTAFADALTMFEPAQVDSVITRLVFFRDHADLADDLAATGGQDERAMVAILGHDTLLSDALAAAEREHGVREEREKRYVTLVRNLDEALGAVGGYADALMQSPSRELDRIVNVLNGGYLAPSTGGDPIANPRAVPTGRNLTAIDAETTPTVEAWSVGVELAKRTIQEKLAATGAYPNKVAISLWGGEFIRTRGVNLAMILYLLGAEPVRNSRGVVHDVALIPAAELGRPRIDVVVQTSGQYRDIAASRIFLINRAVKLASEADDPSDFENNVHTGTLAAEAAMKREGMTPLDARTFSTARVFGGLNGAYGTGITGMVEAGDTWESDTEIAEQYIKNMGAVYTEEKWGHYAPGMFAGALQNTDTVVHGRSSNTWGPLSLDHVYEFMGGISAAARHVTGTDPDAYFSDLRNAYNPTVESVKRAIWTETRTTMLNPKYITALQEDGASAAEVFAETFRNTYGWNVMKPAEIDEEVWEGFYEVYVRDTYDLGMEQYFREKNPYALQEMSAVMLETIRKGYWDADRETRETLASLHAALVCDHEAGCSGFVCDNVKLREFIGTLVTPDLEREYAAAIDAARIGAVQEPVEGMVLEKQTITLETVKQVIAENATALILLAGIMVLFTVAVLVGARRRAL